MNQAAAPTTQPQGPVSDHEVILRLDGITMLYPGTTALNNVSIEVRAGECHGIIGKNGAGKTTLMKIISGIVQQTEGRIQIRDREIKSLSRRRSRAEGISIVTQEPQIIPDFTVAENLFYPDYIRKSGGRINWKEIVDRSQTILMEAGFNINVQAKASDLSISEQQLLLVLRAFFVDESQVVILDEVTAALTQKDQDFLFEIMDRQTRQGKAILFISHRLGEIMRVCQRVTVLRDGRKITTDNVSCLDEKQLADLIVGEDYTAELAQPETEPAGPTIAPVELLAVKDLTKAGFFKQVSFCLHQGEILGLAGLRGSGRTEIMKTIAGAMHPDRGVILVKGQEVRLEKPAQALRRGIVYLPEDRDQEGLIESLSVRFNLSLSSIAKMTRHGLISKAREDRMAYDLVKKLSIRAASLDQEVHSLSGGNRQKVVVGRLMSAAPRVYLLDEPTKGVDIGAKKTILNIVRQHLVREAGVILTSPGLDDLMAVSDRILVLYDGRITRTFARKEFSQAAIYQAMQGVTDRPSDRPGAVG